MASECQSGFLGDRIESQFNIQRIRRSKWHCVDEMERAKTIVLVSRLTKHRVWRAVLVGKMVEKRRNRIISSMKIDFLVPKFHVNERCTTGTGSTN